MQYWTTVVSEPKSYERSDLGRVVTGTYGKKYVIDADGNEVDVDDYKPRIVRGRGRPKKNSNESGESFVWSQANQNIQVLWS